MINETRERFIKSIAEKVAPDRMVEAFFFPAIRQGPIETGVAVIAATQVPALVEPADPAIEIAEVSPADDLGRAEVLTASYRWTRKGVERGKWLVEVTAVADAPLETVETVVRGVQQRAGEALDAHRMSGDEIRAVLPPVAPTEAAPEATITEAVPESAPTESAA